MPNIIKYIFFFISYTFLHNIKKRYKIYKDFNNNKEIKLVEPIKIKTHFYFKDEERLKTLKLDANIIIFKETLANNIPSDSLNILYNNLKTIEVSEKIIFIRNLLLIGVAGSYLPKQNKIKILKYFEDYVIYHELFHMASTIYDKQNKIIFSGFAQYSSNFIKKFGVGLNEGYTEVLSERYFYKNDYASKQYKLCMFYSKKLEEIIGQYNMTSAYLSADLPKLIKELMKYDTKENIVKFISNLDFILNHINGLYNPMIFSKSYIEQKLKIKLSEIENSLIKWYIKKLNNDVRENKITNNQFINSINNYYKELKRYELLENLNIPNKSLEDYKEVKMIKKRIQG